MSLWRYVGMLCWPLTDRHLCPDGCPDRVQVSRRDALAMAWRLGGPLGNLGLRRADFACAWRFGLLPCAGLVGRGCAPCSSPPAPTPAATLLSRSADLADG